VCKARETSKAHAKDKVKIQPQAKQPKGAENIRLAATRAAPQMRVVFKNAAVILYFLVDKK
jgi:hypothetical protein